MAAKKETAQSARGVAFRVLLRVEASDSYADILLSKEIGKLKDNMDRALATELVYGVLRWQIKIDWIIDIFSKIRTNKLEHSVLTALRLGIYQLFFLTNIPIHAAIDETVELLKPDVKKAGFVNAVLRSAQKGKSGVSFPMLKREPVKYISVVFSHPRWIVERWIQRYGVKQAIELCQSNLKVPSIAIRVNTLEVSREELKKELLSKGAVLEDCRYSPDGLVLTHSPKGVVLAPTDKRYYIQDEASQLVSRLLAPRPGSVVLDACAAPGGKTTHIAQLMEGSGRVFAIDKSKARSRLVEAATKRFSLSNITITVADAAKLEIHPELFGTEGAMVDSFDSILVDAPCSGLGVLGRTPDIKYKRSPEDLVRLAKVQRDILSNLARYVKRKGCIVYSVCSLEPEESDEVVEWFLSNHSDFSSADARLYLPESCHGLVDNKGWLRTMPSTSSIDGFFAARLERA